ncbi:MAG: excinuclease ABC subunit B [Myxococcota bacterium]|jgi:excinuclease ABC subunit B
MVLPDTFQLVTDKTPRGDQPNAIQEIRQGLLRGDRHQVLLGVTGSGKTFTMANVIEQVGWPTLVMAPNKTLAAQLHYELKQLFPHNAVEYFVSYYDYYQPEAYVPSTNTYIEKDSLVNDEIDRMRHSATRSLMTRKDVIIVASVSCIYGIGSTEAYYGQVLPLEVGQNVDRDDVLRHLVSIQYARNDLDFHRGTFRVRGDVVEVFPVAEDSIAVRLSFFGDELEEIAMIDPLRGRTLEKLEQVTIFPASHYVTFEDQRKQAVESIQIELKDRLEQLHAESKLLEAQRLEERCLYDLEMLQEIGHCSGIENYTRHLTGREPGEPPPTLVDYFPHPFLAVLDESHITVPQVGAMYRGDRSRKTTLVDFGFRLPSARDNRPLKFGEFLERMDHMVHVSATPGNWELEQTEGVFTEQVVRPTGLLDPMLEMRPVAGQVDDVIAEIRIRIERQQRTLVTTLTKRMSEDLTEYLRDLGIKVRYLHSDVDTLERIAIIRDLRRGVFDVLVGINLLREGLDIPEVTLVAILDADKEGFLRSRRSLIQTIGRASRNVEGRVILYADRITDSIKAAVDETDRRREVQAAYNIEHGITPTTVTSPIMDVNVPEDGESRRGRRGRKGTAPANPIEDSPLDGLTMDDIRKKITDLEKEMWAAAKDERFEDAAAARDGLNQWKQLQLRLG